MAGAVRACLPSPELHPWPSNPSTHGIDRQQGKPTRGQQQVSTLKLGENVSVIFMQRYWVCDRSPAITR